MEVARMPWVRFDDRFDDQDDIDMMSTDAIALNLCATTWSSRNLTDGFIPDARVRRLPGGTAEAVELLCAGDKPWWERVAGGYQIRSFLKYNPSAEDVKAQRQAAADRKAKWRESRPGVTEDVPERVTPPVTDAGSHAGSHAVTDGVTNIVPDGGCPTGTDAPCPSRVPGTRIPDPEIPEGESLGAATPPPTPRRGSPPASDLDREFDEFKAVFPRRLGDAKAAKGRERFGKLRAAGVDLDRLLGGAKRYAAFCDATAKTRTEFVQQIPTWLNGRGWELDWEIPDDAPNRPKQVSTGPEPVYRVAEGQVEEPPPPAEREGRQGLRHASGNGLTESDKRKLIQAQIEQARAGHV